MDLFKFWDPWVYAKRLYNDAKQIPNDEMCNMNLKKYIKHI